MNESGCVYAHAHRSVHDLQLQPVSVSQIWARVCDGEEKRGFWMSGKNLFHFVTETTHTHIGAHTSSQTQNQTLSSCQAESFLGLTLIYELWGGRNVAGTLTVDVSATLRSG